MIRFILVALLVVGFLIFSIPLLLWENHVGKQDPEKQQAHSLKIVQAMFRLILRISGVQVTVRGAGADSGRPGTLCRKPPKLF